MKNLIVFLFGALSFLLVALAVHWLDSYFDISILGFSLFFIVPVGAIGAGFFSALGFMIGARVLQSKPGISILFGVLILSISAWFLVKYLDYREAHVEGVPLSQVVSFGEYLHETIVSTEMVFRNHGREVGATGKVGLWGYPIALLEIIGLSLGGLAIYGILCSMPYCDGCQRFFASSPEQSVTVADQASLALLESSIRDLCQENHLHEVITLFQEFLEEQKPLSNKKDPFRVKLQHWKCQGCEAERLEYQVERKNGQEHWTKIEETVIKGEMQPVSKDNSALG